MTTLGRAKGHFAALGVLATLATAAVVSPAVGGPNFLTLPEAKRVFFTKAQTNSQFLRKSAGYSRSQANAAFLTQAEGDAAFLNQVEGDARYLEPAEGNGLFLDQAEADALFLTPSEADNSYLPRGGLVQLQVSPNSWVAGNDTAITVSHDLGGVELRSSVAGNNKQFFAAITLPSFTHSQTAEVVNFELCYGTSGAETIDRVAMNVTPSTAADISGTIAFLIDDQTDRTDTTCRIYSPTSPFTIGAQAFPQILVQVDYSSAGAVDIGRLTINLTD